MSEETTNYGIPNTTLEHRGDFFASDPGDVCARCGHLSTSHNATWDIDTDSTKSWCNKKGCTCAGFLLAEPEPTAEPAGATFRRRDVPPARCSAGAMFRRRDVPPATGPRSHM